ncbi:helix-turn-helix domain-containing protein [Streptacidiphilus monticola]|uniref:Helix-turn-helix domain-containing protein n=1 Tax=Streptacidiphilus monticola TaxID=2161674 RepID=A0ABW1G5P7_9ACTN
MEFSRPWTAAAAAETGRRVRRLRTERGLSLSELARRAGIGKATLSGLETGTRNPTAETLYALAGQLGVPLAAFLPPPSAEAPEVEGTAVTARLLERFEDGGVSTELYRLEIRPGVRQISPAHGPRVTEHLTVFQGVALVGPPSAPLTLRAGEHGSFRSDVPHTYAALGEVAVHATLLIRHPL